MSGTWELHQGAHLVAVNFSSSGKGVGGRGGGGSLCWLGCGVEEFRMEAMVFPRPYSEEMSDLEFRVSFSQLVHFTFHYTPPRGVEGGEMAPVSGRKAAGEGQRQSGSWNVG